MSNAQMYRMEITIAHGDGDFFETIRLGPYRKQEAYIVAGIIQAFKEMKASDEKTNNEMAYDECLHFRRYLRKHWKYDRFAQECDLERYVYTKEYHVFYTNEKGEETEIDNVVCDTTPKDHYYLKLESSMSGFTFFDTWDVISTFEPLDAKTIRKWKLVSLLDGEAALQKHNFKKCTVNPKDFDDEQEFLITGHFEVLIDSEEQEEAFFNWIEELKATN